MSKAMSKAELAALFGIHRDTLMRWIKNNNKLSLELEKAGYKLSQKIFTPQQVDLIFSYFS